MNLQPLAPDEWAELRERMLPWWGPHGMPATILTFGESGTGKELLARAIHNTSLRKQRALVKINCAALPANLIESELFGHEKGAFTGALTSKRGRFDLADGGTLFLDEIGDFPLDLQAKILRVLQEKKISPVGSTQEIEVDTRLIFATHRNLEEMVQAGDFREDLWFRLAVFPIELAPLRERLDRAGYAVSIKVGFDKDPVSAISNLVRDSAIDLIAMSRAGGSAV